VREQQQGSEKAGRGAVAQRRGRPVWMEAEALNSGTVWAAPEKTRSGSDPAAALRRRSPLARRGRDATTPGDGVGAYWLGWRHSGAAPGRRGGLSRAASDVSGSGGSRAEPAGGCDHEAAARMSRRLRCRPPTVASGSRWPAGVEAWRRLGSWRFTSGEGAFPQRDRRRSAASSQKTITHFTPSSPVVRPFPLLNSPPHSVAR